MSDGIFISYLKDFRTFTLYLCPLLLAICVYIIIIRNQDVFLLFCHAKWCKSTGNMGVM